MSTHARTKSLFTRISALLDLNAFDSPRVTVLERAYEVLRLFPPRVDQRVEHVVNHAAPLGRRVPQSLEVPHAVCHRPGVHHPALQRQQHQGVHRPHHPHSGLVNAHNHDCACCGQACKDVHDGSGIGAVQSRRGLVQEHHPGVNQKLRRDAHAALLPAGDSARELVPNQA